MKETFLTSHTTPCNVAVRFCQNLSTIWVCLKYENPQNEVGGGDSLFPQKGHGTRAPSSVLGSIDHEVPGRKSRTVSLLFELLPAVPMERTSLFTHMWAA